MARASGQTAAQHWKSKPGRGRTLSLVPAGTTALSSVVLGERRLAAAERRLSGRA